MNDIKVMFADGQNSLVEDQIIYFLEQVKPSHKTRLSDK